MVSIDYEKCIGCGLCAKDCFRRAIDIQGKKAVFNDDRQCVECGHCFAVCPKNAITLDNYEPSEVIELAELKHSVNAEDLLGLLQYRRSVRQFSKEVIDDADLEKILKAGRYAPTGRNLQEISFVVVDNTKREFTDLLWDALEKNSEDNIANGIDVAMSKRHLDAAKRYKADPENTPDTIGYGAPLLIGLVSDDSKIGGTIGSYDAGLAAANIEHVAVALGYGCLHGGFGAMAAKDKKVREYLELKDSERLVMFMAIGKPKNELKYFRTVQRKTDNIRRIGGKIK